MVDLLPLLHRYLRSTEKVQLEDFLTAALGGALEEDGALGRAFVQRLAEVEPTLAGWADAALQVSAQESVYTAKGAFVGRADLVLRLARPGDGRRVVIEAKVHDGGVTAEQIGKYASAWPDARLVSLVGRNGTPAAGFGALRWEDVAEVLDKHGRGVVATGLRDVLVAEGEASPWLHAREDDLVAMDTLYRDVATLRRRLADTLPLLYRPALRAKVRDAIDLDDDTAWPSEGFGLGLDRGFQGEAIRGLTLGAVPSGGALRWVLEARVAQARVRGREAWRSVRGQEGWYAAELGRLGDGATDLGAELGVALLRARGLLAGLRDEALEDALPAFELGVPAGVVARALWVQAPFERAVGAECAAAVTEATGEEPTTWANSWRVWVVGKRVQAGCNVVVEDRLASAWIYTSTAAPRARVEAAMRAVAPAGVTVEPQDKCIVALVPWTPARLRPGALAAELSALLRVGIPAARG